MYQNINKICRICLEEGVLMPIFDVTDQLSFRIMACAAVQVYQNDGLPSFICNSCASQLDAAYCFRQKVEKSDEHLRRVLEVGTPAIKNESHNIQQYDIYEPPIKCELEMKHENTIPDESPDTACSDKESIVEDKSDILKSSATRKETKVPLKRGRKRKIIKDDIKNENKNISLPVEIEKKKRGRKRGSTVSTSKGEKRARDTTRKHMCDTCGKTFLYFSNLADHARIHTGDKPFVCTVCGNRFAQSGHLMIHARTHTGVKPYQCEFCPRAFTVSHALKKHLRTHTGERPYSCSVCGKAFVTSYHLSNHFKRHTGEKNFKCDWPNCGLGFVNISEMKRHRARHEKPTDFGSKNMNIGQLVPIVQNTLGQFTQTFIQRNDIQQQFPIRVLNDDVVGHSVL